MEKISTPRVALLPRAANLATLAVVVAATWWSGAQRPLGQPMLATAGKAPAAELSGTTTQHQAAVLTASTAAGATTTAAWPAQAATTIAREGLQVVGYQTRAQR